MYVLLIRSGGKVAESEERLQHSVKIVNVMLNRWELKVNWRKTKLHHSLELLGLSSATASLFSAHRFVHTHTHTQ